MSMLVMKLAWIEEAQLRQSRLGDLMVSEANFEEAFNELWRLVQ